MHIIQKQQKEVINKMVKELDLTKEEIEEIIGLYFKYLKLEITKLKYSELTVEDIPNIPYLPIGSYFIIKPRIARLRNYIKKVERSKNEVTGQNEG